MPRQRIKVEKVREILRLNQELKFSIRKTADALRVSKTSVGEYLAEFKRSGLSWHEITWIFRKLPPRNPAYTTQAE